MTRVGIVEDQQMFMNLLAELCRHKFRWDVQIKAPNARLAFERLQSQQPDVMLIDVNLPDEDGIDLAIRIRRAYPSMKCIMLTAECSQYTIYRVRQSGLHGYIDKNAEPETIENVVNSILSNGTTIFSTVVKTVAAKTVQDESAFTKVLSDREQELMALFGMSMSDAEIGMLKNISSDTVAKHKTNIMKKLSLHSTGEIIHYCIDKGFLQVRPDGQVRPAKWMLSKNS